MTLPADYLANTNELICRQGVAAVVDGRVHSAWGTTRIALRSDSPTCLYCELTSTSALRSATARRAVATLSFLIGSTEAPSRTCLGDEFYLLAVFRHHME